VKKRVREKIMREKEDVKRRMKATRETREFESNMYVSLV
jgi:hypothetical protein